MFDTDLLRTRSVLVVCFRAVDPCVNSRFIARVGNNSDHPGRSRDQIRIRNGVVGCGIGTVLVVIRMVWVVGPYLVSPHF